MKKALNYALFISLLGLLACNSQTGSSARVSKASSTKSGAGTNKYDGSKTELPTNGNVTNTDSDSNTKIEIVNFVDPYNGTMSPKLTLPKNFNGYLSIQGINVQSLASRRVKVRFKFGRTRAPIDIDAVVSSAPGLTPQTNIQVLSMNLKSKPFNNWRLDYDLYDYNEYDSTFSNLSPVQDNRNKNLFCRGLVLDDMSDEAVTASSCTSSGDTCRYAYVKIKDKGLVQASYTSGSVFTATTPMTPTTPQTDVNGLGYYIDNDKNLLARCLPELPDFTLAATNAYTFTLDRSVLARDPSETPTVVTNTVTFGYSVAAGVFTGTPTVLSVNGSTRSFTYEGSFGVSGGLQTNGTYLWDLPLHALFGSNGVYYGALTGTTVFNTNSSLYESGTALTSAQIGTVIDAIKTGTTSLLFPRYTKLQLSSGVQYFGTDTASAPSDAKILQVMNSAGETTWMDGCNARVKTTDPVTLEHVGSCNVTAEVEVVVYNEAGTAEEAWGIKTKNLKLQLVKPAAIGSSGNTLPNVLASGYSNCSKSSQCAGGECCYNGRCWSKKYVSKCVDESITSTAQSGYRLTGASCNSDYQCLSLCCGSGGTCQPHDTLSANPSYCRKSFGQTCVANEWCDKVAQTQYLIVKTGLSELGAVQCELRPYTINKYANCVNGYCINPAQPTIPTFDPTSPTRCNSAQEAPSIDPSGQ